MLAWCRNGTDCCDDSLWRKSSFTVPTCKGATVGASVLLILAAIVTYTSLQRTKVLRRHGANYLSSTASKGRHQLVQACTAVLLTSHMGWLVYYIVTNKTAAPFQFFVEAALLVSWLGATVSQCTDLPASYSHRQTCLLAAAP